MRYRLFILMAAVLFASFGLTGCAMYTLHGLTAVNQRYEAPTVAYVGLDGSLALQVEIIYRNNTNIERWRRQAWFYYSPQLVKEFVKLEKNKELGAPGRIRLWYPIHPDIDQDPAIIPADHHSPDATADDLPPATRMGKRFDLKSPSSAEGFPYRAGDTEYLLNPKDSLSGRFSMVYRSKGSQLLFTALIGPAYVFDIVTLPGQLTILIIYGAMRGELFDLH